MSARPEQYALERQRAHGGLELVPCAGCGKAIAWVVIDEKRVPLDPVPAVYRIFPPSRQAPKPFAERAGQRVTETYLGPLYFVTHFATCPKAAEFSGRGRR